MGLLLAAHPVRAARGRLEGARLVLHLLPRFPQGHLAIPLVEGIDNVFRPRLPQEHLGHLSEHPLSGVDHFADFRFLLPDDILTPERLK